MINIEDYEIIHNEDNNSIAFCCNSRVYKIQNAIHDENENSFYIDNENNLIILDKSGNKIISFMKFPFEYNNTLTDKQRVILISGEPSAHEDEPPEIEEIFVIKKKNL